MATNNSDNKMDRYPQQQSPQRDNQVRITQTSCYFCSEWLDSGASFKSHIAQCGQVLEKCVHCQEVYVQRKLMSQHLEKCNKRDDGMREIKRGAEEVQQQPVTTNGTNYFEDRLRILEEDATSLRAALNDEVRMRLTVITELGTLKRRNQVAEEWTSKVGEVLATLKKCINEETDNRSEEMESVRIELDKLMMRYKALEEWRHETEILLDQLQVDVGSVDGGGGGGVSEFRGQMEALINNNSVTIHKIQRLEIEIEELKSERRLSGGSGVNLPAGLSPATFNHYAEKMNAVDQVFQDQQTLINSVRNYLTTEVNNLKEENLKIRMFCEENSGIVTRLQALDFDVKGIKNIVYETEDKCDKFDKAMQETKSVAMQTKQEMNDLEVHLMHQERLLPIHNMKGRLLWRIGDYSKRLLEAKEKGVVLKSPIISTRQYGYNLRLEVALNGVGTWKGRNIIASLTMVPGEYDTLLAWPCKIEADIILRDQPADLSKANDLKKLVIAKRNGEENLNSSIHIPHKMLSQCSYLRNDAIIFEVRVLRGSN